MCETISEPEVKTTCEPSSQPLQADPATMSEHGITNNCKLETLVGTVTKLEYEPEAATMCQPHQPETTTLSERGIIKNSNLDTLGTVIKSEPVTASTCQPHKFETATTSEHATINNCKPETLGTVIKSESEPASTCQPYKLETATLSEHGILNNCKPETLGTVIKLESEAASTCQPYKLETAIMSEHRKINNCKLETLGTVIKLELEAASTCQPRNLETATLSEHGIINNCKPEILETVTKVEPEAATMCQPEATTMGEPETANNCKPDVVTTFQPETATTSGTIKCEPEISTNCESEVGNASENKPAVKCEPWVRDFIVNLHEPVVFNGMIDDWEMIRWDVEDWTAVFDDEELPVRSATSSCSAFPLWEGQCEAESMTIEELADLDPAPPGEERKWYYFDYKYLREWMPEGNDALKTMTWAKFGYPEYEVNDTTLWIGSKGAHTPLHYDTYGCNLVAQIHGTKRWILFPPKSENMKPTRVPYEESSIYSMWNLDCPLPSDFYINDRKVLIVDLKPGQVLLVPQHWWHFVESLDTTISVNVWLPCISDDKYRLEESLVRLMMHRICTGISDEDRSDLLNPNEHSVGNGKTYMFQSMNVISGVIENCKDSEEEEREAKKKTLEKATEEPPTKKAKLLEINDCGIPSKLQTLNGAVVQHSSLDQLKSLMDAKCHCSSQEEHDALIQREKDEKEEKYSTKVEKIINSFLHPDVMAQVLLKFGESHNLECD